MKDNRTEGYVIIEVATGVRFGGIYESTGGAKNSFNRGYRYHRASSPKFDDQSEYVIKRLVIADE